MTLPLERDICEHIRTQCLGGEGRELSPTTPVLETGILDSFSMLKLVDWIEQRYALRMDSQDLTTENFASIGSIVELVGRKMQAKVAV